MKRNLLTYFILGLFIFSIIGSRVNFSSTIEEETPEAADEVLWVDSVWQNGTVEDGTAIHWMNYD